MNTDFPAEKGTYAILFRLEEAADITIGRLGRFTFPAADYVYVGSAQGSGGLRARLRHHLESAAAPHWHLDYLRGRIKVVDVYYNIGTERLECVWSQKLALLEGAFVPASGFGARDCSSGCRSHLVGFSRGMVGGGIGMLLFGER